MEKIIWVIGDDRLEMIEAQRRINAAGSMRALCLLSFEAVQKAALAQEEGERSRISTPSLIIFDYQMAKKEDFASVLFLRKQQSLGGVPLFFMTEKRSEELDEECYEKGATVVVHKPFSRAGIMRIERTAWQHEATKTTRSCCKNRQEICRRQKRSFGLTNSSSQEINCCIRFLDVISQIMSLTAFWKIPKVRLLEVRSESLR